MQMKKECEGIDVLKICLSILVCLRHIGQDITLSNPVLTFIVTSYLSPTAVPTFFIISGYLFYRNGKPHKDALFKQVKRIAKLYLVWSGIYFPLTLISWIKSEVSIFENILLYLKNVILNGTYYHLWYLPALIVALVVVYCLDKNKLDRKITILSVILFIIGYLIENFVAFLPVRVQVFVRIYLHIFVTARNGVFFGIVFIWFGKIIVFYENKFVNNQNIKRWRNLLIGGFLIQLLEVVGLKIIYGSERANNMLISTLITSPVLFILFRYRRWKVKKIKDVFYWRNISTVLFCIHPAIILVMKKMLNGRLEVVKGELIFISTLICAVGIVALSKKIKGLNVLF